MSILQYAITFNVTQTAIVVLLSLAVLLTVPNRFFRFWTLGFVIGLGLTLIELLASFHGWLLPLKAAFLAGSLAASWAFLQAGFRLREKAPPRAIAIAFGLLALLQAILLLALNPSFGVLVLPAILLLSASLLWLGGTFWWKGVTQRQSRHLWIAVPLMAHGLWVLAFPVIVPSSHAWLGYFVIGGLQSFNGIGMLVYVLRSNLNEQRRLAAQQQQQNLRLAELDRLKSSFVSVVSHELRTPLTAIQGYAEFLEDGLGGELSPAQREYLAEILTGCARLERLVDDLLDFARLESGSLQLTYTEDDISRTVQSVVNALRPRAIAKRITLSTHVPETPVLLSYDGLRIEQVLINLLGNALKFTPDGGEVSVTVLPAPDHVRLEVRDTGIGVDPQKLPRLFEQFFQVDPSSTRQSGGVGLGLAIVKALVEAHGGRIGAESEKGAGSRFWFTLPASGVGMPLEVGDSEAGDVLRVD